VYVVGIQKSEISKGGYVLCAAAPEMLASLERDTERKIIMHMGIKVVYDVSSTQKLHSRYLRVFSEDRRFG
jgi:hypothetical protein